MLLKNSTPMSIKIHKQNKATEKLKIIKFKFMGLLGFAWGYIFTITPFLDEFERGNMLPRYICVVVLKYIVAWCNASLADVSMLYQCIAVKSAGTISNLFSLKY